MKPGFTFLAVMLTALISLAAAPVQTLKTDTTKLAQADQLTPLPLSVAARTSLRAENTPEVSQTCRQQCDVSYIRTHQICVAAVSGLNTPDAPQANACDRAAKAGIRQCQAKCDATSDLDEGKPALD